MPYQMPVFVLFTLLVMSDSSFQWTYMQDLGTCLGNNSSWLWQRSPTWSPKYTEGMSAECRILQPSSHMQVAVRALCLCIQGPAWTCFWVLGRTCCLLFNIWRQIILFQPVSLKWRVLFIVVVFVVVVVVIIHNKKSYSYWIFRYS